MKCSGNCGKDLENEEHVYQVRAGHLDSTVGDAPGVISPPLEEEFIPESDVGYYCSECLAKGV